MLNISTIGGAPELPGAGSVEKRTRVPQQTGSPNGDGVAISPLAARAAESAAILKQAETSEVDGIREEMVERARANLEQGTYRIQEAVLQVARRFEASLA